MRRIIFIMIFGIVLIGGITALTLTTYDVKIEKVGDVYSVYVLKEQKTTTEISSELSQLNKDKLYYTNEVYLQCVQNCPSWCKLEVEYLKLKEVVKGCVEECLSRCELEKEHLIKTADDRISELNAITSVK